MVHIDNCQVPLNLKNALEEISWKEMQKCLDDKRRPLSEDDILRVPE